MIEALDESKEELKRVDHLIYVSLKYTRTVDVLRNVLARLLSAQDYALLSLLKKAIHDRKMADIPDSFKEKCDEIRRIYKKEDKIVELVEFYIFLKKLEKADYRGEQEYRRHVAMIVEIEGKESRLDIDSVTDHYKKVKDQVEFIESIVKGKA
jgi:hypothetical protein